jgi:LPS export ABC transporter protein LptC
MREIALHVTPLCAGAGTSCESNQKDKQSATIIESRGGEVTCKMRRESERRAASPFAFRRAAQPLSDLSNSFSAAKRPFKVHKTISEHCYPSERFGVCKSARSPLTLIVPIRYSSRSRLAALTGACLLLATVLTACQRRAASGAKKRPDALTNAPAQESWNTRLNVYENKHPRMMLRAGHLTRYESEDSTYALMRPHSDSTGERVTVLLFEAKGDTSTIVRADSIFYYNGERRFEARGNVVATTTDKRLETEHLRWNEQSERVHAPGFVRITTPKDQIEGYELRGDEGLENYEIANVTGQVTLE